MEALRQLLGEHGLTLVFANVLLAQLGLPLPAMPMLIVAGALIAEGTVHVLPLALVVVIASLMGDVPWYLAGRRYGYRVLRTLCRIAIEPDTCVKQTENIFSRWGPVSLVFAKYVPGFSTVAPPLAGTMRLDASRFVFYSALAAMLWALAPLLAGFFFHREVEWLLTWLETMGSGALAAIAAFVLAYVVLKGVERYLLIRFLRMVRISVADLRQMLNEGPRPFIIDARSALAREAEPRRIPGALIVELGAVESIAESIPDDRDIVVYCS
ncbi:MAG: VTT domain-containing protein [Burkholderiales bacterium]